MEYSNLSERKKQILYNAIEDYIQFASPITSGNVHEKHLKDISPATLRNELNALEAMGYLKQLHTSSGRVPTTKAYRLFVNELMHQTKFNKKALLTVKEIFSKRTSMLSDIVSSLANVISDATDYPTVVVLKGYEKLIIESIKIVPLIGGNGIVLIGTKNGIINNSISLREDVSQQNCIDASNFLTNRFAGKSLKELRINLDDYVSTMNEDIVDFAGLIDSLIDCLASLTSSSEVASTGATKLLNNPEYSKMDNAKKILQVLEDDKQLINAVSFEDNNEISFSIGSENQSEALEGCSVVKAHYNIDGENVASIGIIGPERMDYSKVASALKYIVEEMKTLEHLTYSNKGEDDEK